MYKYKKLTRVAMTNVLAIHTNGIADHVVDVTMTRIRMMQAMIALSMYSNLCSRVVVVTKILFSKLQVLKKI